MIVPIEQVTQVLRTIYFDGDIRILNSTLVFIQGSMNSWAPHLLLGTRRNLIIANFNVKDEKQVKIFNRREARITEVDDEKMIKAHSNLMRIVINQDEFVIKFLSLHDQRNWTFLIQSGCAPVFRVGQEDGDVYENEGFMLALAGVDNEYFSEIKQSDLPLWRLKQKRSAFIELGDLCKILTERHCSFGLLLNEGNLVYRVLDAQKRVEPVSERFCDIYSKLYVELQNEYVDKKELENRTEKILKRKYVYETKKWNQLCEQKLREIRETYAQYTKHQFPPDMTDSMSSAQLQATDNASGYDLYDPIELSPQILDKLRHGGYSQAREEFMRRITAEEGKSLTQPITELICLFREFHEHCEKVARTMIDEFVLPTHEQEFLDVTVWRNATTLDYLTKTYSKQYETFKKSCATRSQDELGALEDKMTQFGPVHGSIMGTFGQQLRQYAALLMQPRNFVAGTRLSSLPPSSEDDPVFEYGPENGFPDGLIETTIDGFVYEKAPMIYPNQLSPVYEVSNGGVNFKFVVERDGHSQLNIRRDTFAQANRDNIVIDQARVEMECMQALYDCFSIENINEQLRVPLCCVVKYCGFSVFCQADISEQQVVYGYSASGDAFLTDERVIPRIEIASEQLNIEPHLFVANSAFAGPLVDSEADLSFVLRLADNLDEYDGFGDFAGFLRLNAVDICAQIPYIQEMQLSDGTSLRQAHLSALVQIFEDENYYIKNTQSTALPDLPSVFVQQILPLLSQQAARKRSAALVQDKLAEISQACKLPGKYTKLIDERFNPDACLAGLKISESELGRVTETVKQQFGKMKTKTGGNVDPELFAKFVAYSYCEHQYTAGMQRCERWSDLYRIEYLPILMAAIDRQLLADRISMLEIPYVLQHFQVPAYLWLYTANFSQLPEVLEIVRLAIVARAISRYLDDSLRKIRRQIQQYGIENAFVLQLDPVAERKKDKRAMLEAEQLLNLESMLVQAANKMEAEQVVARLRPKRMNFFTAGSKEERLLYADQFIKQYVAAFLNSIFALNETTSAVWGVINQIVEHFYQEHAFAEEYTRRVRESQLKDEIEVSDFVSVPLVPQTLFMDSVGLEKGALGTNYRLLLLDWICEESGIIINDLNTYVFTQTDQIFRYSDIIAFATNFQMPLPEFVAETCNVPFRRWLDTALQIEAEVANRFSFKLNYQTNEEKFTQIQGQFVMRRLRAAPESQILRELHYNVAFSKLTNLTNTHEFEFLFAESALFLIGNVWTEFAPLFKADNLQKAMPGIRRYIEMLETAVVLMTAALSICRRNSGVGVAIYRAYSQLMNEVARFEAQLKAKQPSIMLTIEREIVQNESFYSDARELQRFETSQEAAQMAIIASKNILRGGSIEVAKLLLIEAAHQYAAKDFEQSLSLLQDAERVAETRNKDKCDFLLEIYNLRGIVYGKLGDVAKAENCFTAAKNLHSYHIDCSKRALARLSMFEEQLEVQISNYKEAGAAMATQLGFRFADNANEEALLEFKRAFALSDDLNEGAGDAFSDARGVPTIQEQALQSRIALELLYNEKSMFPRDIEQAHTMAMRSDADIGTACTERAISTLNQRLLNALTEHDRSYLFLSQILENEAVMYLNAPTQSKLAVGRKNAIEALRMRQQVLSQTHPFTLKALITISEFDGKMGETQKQITALEFALRSLGTQIIEDLNPVFDEDIDRLWLFKKLAACVFVKLPPEMQTTIKQAREVASKRRDFGAQLVFQAMQKICASDNIAREIARVVEAATLSANKNTVSDLVYLLKCVQDDIPVSTDMQFEMQGGQNRGVYDLVEAVQITGQNQMMVKQAYTGGDEEDDW